MTGLCLSHIVTSQTGGDTLSVAKPFGVLNAKRGREGLVFGGAEIIDFSKDVYSVATRQLREGLSIESQAISQSEPLDRVWGYNRDGYANVNDIRVRRYEVPSWRDGVQWNVTEDSELNLHLDRWRFSRVGNGYRQISQLQSIGVAKPVVQYSRFSPTRDAILAFQSLNSDPWPAICGGRFLGRIDGVASNIRLPSRLLCEVGHFCGLSIEPIYRIVDSLVDFPGARSKALSRQNIGFRCLSTDSCSRDQLIGLTRCTVVILATRDPLNHREECNRSREEKFNLYLPPPAELEKAQLYQLPERFGGAIRYGSALLAAFVLWCMSLAGFIEFLGRTKEPTVGKQGWLVITAIPALLTALWPIHIAVSEQM